jgi:signal transduction histidine kinase
VSQATVLLVSDDAEFARAVLGHWQAQADAPAFVVLTGSADPQAVASFDLAIVARVAEATLGPLLPMVERGRPVLCLAKAASLAGLRRAHAGITFVAGESGPQAAEIAVLIGSEMLRRGVAIERLRQLERAARERERHAALGRMLLEVRHELNNALTAVLGNAELLLLGTPNGSREQLQTVHDGALRIHDIVRRLAQLDAELKFAEGDMNVVPMRAARVN